MKPPRIYLDHAATSPLRPEARAAMEEGFAIWANPSSPHAEGRKAKQALEDARARVKAALKWDGEVIFTSGASEALALGLSRTKAERRIASAVEHDAAFFAGEDFFDTILPVDDGGDITRGAIYEALGVIGIPPGDVRPPSLTCLQHVNSETGAVFPLDGIRRVMGNFAEASLITDCSQSAGKLELPEGADMVVVSAHKLGGPIGIGALLVRDFNQLHPVGGHERGYRRGTENLPDVLGMAAALEAGDWATTAEQRVSFRDSFGDNVLRIGEQVDYIVPLTHPTLSAQALLIRLDAMGFAVSAGSACSSGTLKKSRVLDAFGVPDDVAARTIRVSMGWSTRAKELEAFAGAWASLK